jgi:hypothetical protein
VHYRLFCCNRCIFDGLQTRPVVPQYMSPCRSRRLTSSRRRSCDRARHSTGTSEIGGHIRAALGVSVHQGSQSILRPPLPKTLREEGGRVYSKAPLVAIANSDVQELKRYLAWKLPAITPAGHASRAKLPYLLMNWLTPA